MKRMNQQFNLSMREVKGQAEKRQTTEKGGRKADRQVGNQSVIGQPANRSVTDSLVSQSVVSLSRSLVSKSANQSFVGRSVSESDIGQSINHWSLVYRSVSQTFIQWVWQLLVYQSVGKWINRPLLSTSAVIRASVSKSVTYQALASQSFVIQPGGQLF